jgi:hypothetical protein
MTRPLLIDLFCGSGGGSVGYWRAGFDVIGVDLHPMPNYPFTFIRADAFKVLDALISKEITAAAVHASPPCQHYARVTRWRGNANSHPDLIYPVWNALKETGIPYVLENVPEALPEWDLVLCGTSFELRVKRHRGFRLSFSAPQIPCRSHKNIIPFEHKNERAFADAMQCKWMSAKEARESIPPAYTRYIGNHLVRHLATQGRLDLAA